MLTKEDYIHILFIAMLRELVQKSLDSANEITLHAGQARPFSEVDEDERAERGRGREEWDAEGGEDYGVRRGGVRRSARTTRSICMLGDVDHVGRGWPAAPGCWLASGHPNATPTPTHAVLSSPRAIQPPCTSTAVGGARGDAGVQAAQRRAKRLYLLPPNTVTEFGGIVENWKLP